MKHHILTIVLAAFAIVSSTSRADAQCRPDDIFCAELRIGPAQPPAPPVVVAPPPPVVYVQPPPPPPVVVLQAAPPPPPRVIVTAPPPPVVIAPPPVVLQTRPRRVVQYDLVPAFDMGLHFDLSGLAMDGVRMGGVRGAFRLRPVEHFALDFGLGLYGGESALYGIDRGGERVELPVFVNGVVFFNPQHRFQVYLVAGVGASYAAQALSGGRQRDFGYVGGELGIGFEWRLSRFFALNLDARGFVRQHVSEGGPEFTRQNADGTLESTDLSGGIYGNAGMTFYFGG